MPRPILLLLSLMATTCLLPNAHATGEAPQKLSYDRDVRPILSENCFTCHGFDTSKRQAGLRLDMEESAHTPLASGKVAVMPFALERSELYARVIASGALHMPPLTSGKKLTAAQVAVLKRWIQQGAKYEAHWSFVPPKRPPLPAVKNGTWARTPIDRFILARLEAEHLTPSPEADRRTLIRRVSLDLTGLPPTPAEVAAFLADNSPNAYEKVVDRLLASPHYGERMALGWLDSARYADTHGYHIDSQRDMWRWRDWVIDAFNRDLPYDQFTIQQLAGDLLPNATLDQKIASGFNRNHPITLEGGAIPEEYQANYIFDRIDTTATTWMGLTVRCAQCHDHKYDPITQKDYYRFYAFFNNIQENGLDGYNGNAVPILKAPQPGQQERLDALNQQLAATEDRVKARQAEVAPKVADWIRSASSSLGTATPVTAGLAAHYRLDEMQGDKVRDSIGGAPVGTILGGKPNWKSGKVYGALSFDGNTYCDLGTSIALERTERFSYGAWVYPTSNDGMTVFSRMTDDASIRGWDLYLAGGKVYAHLLHQWPDNALRIESKQTIDQNTWTHLFVTYDGSGKGKGLKLYINGKPAEVNITHDTLTDTILTPKPLLIGKRAAGSPFKGAIDEVRIYNRELHPEEVATLARVESIWQAVTTAPERRTPALKAALTDYYLTYEDQIYPNLLRDRDLQRKQRDDFDKTIPTTMVMQEREKHRDTFMLVRGQYDKPGAKVTPGTPEMLPPLPAGAPVDRLALARWLVAPSHPLTARVAVNRFWQNYFGLGLVKTAENFGYQGEPPSHPELLDWLATEFIRTGWDVKAMQRLIVTSATYRQASRVTPELLEKDPENRLLARAPRNRLPAEIIRDQALAVSGLLVDKIGGPSVKPYQPAGIWEDISFKAGFTAQYYEQDHGEALYRRGMYTFWKRTCPPPALQAFDAPEREFCIVRRSPTNTPLQALVLLNDPTYVEAARKLAERILTEPSTLTPTDRLAWAYNLLLARPPKPGEVRVLLHLLETQTEKYHRDNAAALKLLEVGESKRNTTLDAADVAAWTSVANAILNLDETITRI